MNSTAEEEIEAKSSEGKSRLTCDMLRYISCLVSPENGENPVRRT